MSEQEPILKKFLVGGSFYMIVEAPTEEEAMREADYIEHPDTYVDVYRVTAEERTE